VKNGCTRIQKSIFLADLPSSKYEKIRNDLTEVQAAYENLDSILVVPISTDYLKSMKIIDKNISVDVITKSKNTLFF
jgi:CRISPR-associated protein Cas2